MLSLKKSLIMFLVFFLLFTLSEIPVYGALYPYKPFFILLGVFYFSIFSPDRFGIFIAFFLGFTIDVISGSVLGVHAFAYAMITYFVLKIRELLLLGVVLQVLFIFLFGVLLAILENYISGRLLFLQEYYIVFIKAAVTVVFWAFIRTFGRLAK